MELLGHTIVLLKGFLRNSHYFPQWPHRFTFLQIVYEHSLFSTSLPQLCSFWWQPFWQMWGDISLWFWFAFPSWLVLLPGKSHGRRSLVGCSPWGRWGSDTTERLHFHFSLSCIGEGNGNPLQCSCLENPRDGGAWWAAIYGVAQSQTRLKRLSSSSSSSMIIMLSIFSCACWSSAFPLGKIVYSVLPVI